MGVQRDFGDNSRPGHCLATSPGQPLHRAAHAGAGDRTVAPGLPKGMDGRFSLPFPLSIRFYFKNYRGKMPCKKGADPDPQLVARLWTEANPGRVHKG